MVLVAYDILVDEETRMSPRSLESIPSTIYQEENHNNDANIQNKAPLIEKVLTRNVKSLTKTLRDPNFGFYVEKWMDVLRQNEEENLKILRKILARREIGRTFKEMDTMSKKDKTHPINPSDFKELIVQSLDSLLNILSDRADENEVVAARFVGACAKVLLLKLKEKESDDFNIHDYLENFVNDEVRHFKSILFHFLTAISLSATS